MSQKQNNDAASIEDWTAWIMVFIFAPIFLIVIFAWLMGAGSSSSGMTQSDQDYWDSRSQEEKIQILSDYYEETNPNW